MLLNPFYLHQPKSLSEAAQILNGHKDTRLLAGGTFLINQLKQLRKKGLKTPGHIISLDAVNELKGFERNKDRFVIKSMTTIADLADIKDISFLRQICLNIATTPIRNMATLGGNLTCRYTWSELPSVMIACDASLHFVDATGSSEKLPAETFYKNNAKTNKILSQISIKNNAPSLLSYQRVKKTLHIDIPMFTVCVKVSFNKKAFSNVRVVVNTGNQFPQRDTLLENFLNGKTPQDSNLINCALNNLDKNICAKLNDTYKSHMHGICVKNALNEIIQQKSKL